MISTKASIIENNQQIDVWYLGKDDVAKKFCPLQLEWYADGWTYDGGNGDLQLLPR
jgi:hypothetical protein